MKIEKAKKRDKKIHKRKHGMKVDGSSVKLIVQIQKDVSDSLTKNKE